MHGSSRRAQKNRPDSPAGSVFGRLRAQLRKFGMSLQPAAEAGPVWKYLPALLLLAFALRAALALAGDFVLHPDEIMQYLEPAHRAVFGSGVVYWEFFHGARQWLVPGLVASVLWLGKAAGLDSPFFYIDAVKLVFCLLSVLVPWGVYMYARNSCGELAGRVALLLAVLWYDQIGFAHKPFTEFVSTSILFAALGVAVLPASSRTTGAAAAGALFMLAALVRVQYLPVAGLFALARMVELDVRGRTAMALGAAALFAAVGALDWATWGAPFWSYLVNIQVNLGLSELRTGESPWHLQFVWLIFGSMGMVLLAAWTCVTDLRRHMLVAAALAFLLLFHTLQPHKEFRFIFLAGPLWMIPAAALLASLPERLRVLKPAACAALVGVSALFLLNAMPGQEFLYKGFSRETGKVNFLLDQDGIFDAFRAVSQRQDVESLYVTRTYFNTPGYYYLHKRIPFYDNYTIRYATAKTKQPPENLFTHLLTPPATKLAPEAEVLGEYGDIVLYRNPDKNPDLPLWQDYSVMLADNITAQIIRTRMGSARPLPLPIRFATP